MRKVTMTMRTMIIKIMMMTFDEDEEHDGDDVHKDDND
jgi:hypothetical protein